MTESRFWISRGDTLHTGTADPDSAGVQTFLDMCFEALTQEDAAADIAVVFDAKSSEIVFSGVFVAEDAGTAVNIAEKVFVSAIERAGAINNTDENVIQWRTHLLENHLLQSREGIRSEVVQLAGAGV